MFLALDVGNSAVKGGLFEHDDLVEVFSLSPPAGEAPGDPAAVFGEQLRSHLPTAGLDGAGLVSVVPERSRALQRALREITGDRVTVVRPDMALPFTLEYETPDTLGIDRLAAAAAGWMEYGQPGFRSVIVVDVGTAINYEVVHRRGAYLGGAIAPGPALARDALHTGTAQLPDVSLDVPAHSVGSSTESGLQSGIMWGLVDAVQGMTQRLTDDLPDAPAIVLTGGWSPTLADHVPHDHHVPHLVLRGVRLLTRMNRPASDE